MFSLLTKTLLCCLPLVAVAVGLLSVRLFFGRGFVKTHTSQNAALRRRGIGCVQSQDAQERHRKPLRK